MIVKHQNRL
jgi:hypothetical protein